MRRGSRAGRGRWRRHGRVLLVARLVVVVAMAVVAAAAAAAAAVAVAAAATTALVRRAAGAVAGRGQASWVGAPRRDGVVPGAGDRRRRLGLVARGWMGRAGFLQSRESK